MTTARLALFVVSGALALLPCACADDGAGPAPSDGSPADAATTDGATTGAPSCLGSWDDPSEGPASGDYRDHLYDPAQSAGIAAVAISTRGFRTVAGSEAGEIYLFRRGQTEPVFSPAYDTGSPNDVHQVTSVAIGRAGNAYVAGDDAGRIYYFECDEPQPLRIFDVVAEGSVPSGNRQVQRVAISHDGYTVAAVAHDTLFLFARSMTARELKLVRTERFSGESLASVALSGDGARAAVGSFARDDGSVGVHVVAADPGVAAEHRTLSEPYGGSNIVGAPVAVSAAGRYVAAGGLTGIIRVWDLQASGTDPLWQFGPPAGALANDNPVWSLALSDDAERLVAIVRDGSFSRLYYFDGVTAGGLAAQPAISHDGTMIERSFFGQPPVYQGETAKQANFDQLLDLSFDVHNFPNSLGLSADGSYFAAGVSTAGDSLGHAAAFYGRERDPFGRLPDPFRMLDLDGDMVLSIALSPDGSWVVLGGQDHALVRRMEIAPAALVKVQPVTLKVDKSLPGDIGSGKISVDYLIVKPGRAATLKQRFRFTSGPLDPIHPVPGIPSKFLCSGDTEVTFDRVLADGDTTTAGNEKLTTPTCQKSEISFGTFDSFILRSILEATGQSDMALSDWSDIVVKFSVL